MEGFGGIIAFTLGWLSAQLLKLIIGICRGKKRIDWSSVMDYLTRSGGMPSGHAASFVALTMFLGCYSGFDTGVFAVSFGTTLIIIYDAVNVRRAVGEQGRLLNSAAKKLGKKEQLRVVEGHTIPQVIVGALLGILIGWVVFCLCHGL